MICLKSIALVGVGVLSVAVFMAVALLCPFAFMNVSRRAVKAGENSSLDSRLNVHQRRWGTVMTGSADLMAAV
jgi:hypothetical protein